MTQRKPSDIDKLVMASRRQELREWGIDPDTPAARRWVRTGKLLSHTPCSVYRCYDREDQLLYVGITGQALKRAKQHRLHVEWWTQMVRQEWEHFYSRERALEREQEIIKTELPLYNVIGKKVGT